MGTQYDLVTSSYGIRNNRPIVYVWGRDAERNKKLFVLKSEKPHFYIPVNEREIVDKFPYMRVGETTKDIFGVDVLEVFTQIPKQVGDIRRREVFSKTWEADIRFPLAMLIKRGIYGSFEITDDGKMIPCEPLYVPLRTAILDMEVLSPAEIFPDPELAEWPMVSMAVHDNYLHEWNMFVWLKGEEERSEDKYFKEEDDEIGDVHYYHIFNNEESFLRAIIDFFVEREFDIITGWNSNSFDMLYWYNRVEYLNKRGANLDIKSLSPIGAVYKRGGFTKTYMSRGRSEVYASGLILFDGLTAYKKVMVARGELESYSLAYVAWYELKKTRIKESQEEVVASGDVFKIGEYPLRDALWTKEILDKRRVITYFDRIRKISGCRMEDSTINSRILDSFCLHKAHDKGFVLPSKPKVPADYRYKGGTARYKGAIVRSPIVGRHRNIGVIDFSGHYPNSMIGCNMSPETLVTGELEAGRPFIEIGNGVRFYSDVKGFVPELLEELKVERRRITAEMDEIAAEKGTTCDEWDVLYWLQFAVKFINTAFYGVFAYPGFRLYMPEISDSTTFIGRKAMNYAVDIVENDLQIPYHKFVVVYGDTDSFFVTLPESTLLELDTVADYVNHRLRFLEKELHMIEPFLVKSERIFKALILKDAKKRYFGEMVWKDGAYIDADDPGRFQTKGFEAKRSDSSRFTQHVQKTILQMLVNFESKEDILEFVKGAIDKAKSGYYFADNVVWIDLGIPKGFSSAKKLIKRNDPWARGARYAYLHYDKLILQHYKPKLLYVNFKGGTINGKWYSPTKEISFEDISKVPPFFFDYIDWERIYDKCIRAKLEELLDVVGIDIKEVGVGQASLKMWMQ